MAVITAPGHDVEGALAASVAVTATRASYTITESEAPGDVILLRKMPAGASFLLIASYNGGGAISGAFVLAREDGTIVSTLLSGIGLTGVFQIQGTVPEEDLYFAVRVDKPPNAGDAGTVMMTTVFYQFGEP